ncbi:FixH family protein [Marivirga arenosa]|uniref:FixH family protein n=1 Tax=Marivirga arenosa TaxID=3059076 RepID=A0AA49GI49_9BACT|nr:MULTISPECIES: FixH family protein [unclassified Marivirga]WKK79244.1 FixH family protein [Marivirga sp. BKB1-2]WMN06066.1 FixH family protein [Marivirga sp. ABR2-2]
MNWGNKITIVFISFVILVITMVTISMKQDFYLVEENYYEEEIAYQSKMEEIKNGQNWQGKIRTIQNGNIVSLSFEDADKVSGKISFIRPADANLDFFIPLTEEANIPVEKFEVGNWKVAYEWEQGGVKYFKEDKIFIQK